MRIWHEKLIPVLCRQHLLACWREGLGCYAILINNKKGYRNHPAVKEFENSAWHLWVRLERIRSEMIKRGYKPKELPNGQHYTTIYKNAEPKEWQSLEQQIEVLKSKKCQCKV